MNKKYELVIKGISSHPDKVVVTVALESDGYPTLFSPHVVIKLDRVDGAALELYEAEAKKRAKKIFMDAAAGLCDSGSVPEKRLHSAARYTIKINGSDNSIAGF